MPASDRAQKHAGSGQEFGFSEALTLAGIASHPLLTGTAKSESANVSPMQTDENESGSTPGIELVAGRSTAAHLSRFMEGAGPDEAGAALGDSWSVVQTQKPASGKTALEHEAGTSPGVAEATACQAEPGGDVNSGEDGIKALSGPHCKKTTGEAKHRPGIASGAAQATRQMPEAEPPLKGPGEGSTPTMMTSDPQEQALRQTACLQAPDPAAPQEVHVQASDNPLWVVNPERVTGPGRNENLHASRHPAAMPLDNQGARPSPEKEAAAGGSASSGAGETSGPDSRSSSSGRPAYTGSHEIVMATANHGTTTISTVMPAPAELARSVSSSAQQIQAPFHASLAGGTGPLHDRTGELQMRPNQLEVGFHDAALGWLSVRTSLAETGGVHASLSGSSHSANGALGEMLPGLERYLRQHSVDLASVSLLSKDAPTAPAHDVAQVRASASSSSGSPTAADTAQGDSPSKRPQAEQHTAREETQRDRSSGPDKTSPTVRALSATAQGSNIDVRI